MKKKKWMAVIAAVIIGVSAYSGYSTYQAHNQNLESDLLLANIEVLAEIETETSWSCDASSSGPCKASCGVCFTQIEGTGKVIGTHSCTRN
jgi:hypothetical protein